MTAASGSINSIAILDCGGQYTKVIDRRIREMSVKSDIFPIGVAPGRLDGYDGLILSGGPASVWKEGRPDYDDRLFELSVPILGICYGMHMMNAHFGGDVVPGLRREYGETDITVDPGCPLFEGLERSQRVLMSHGDSIESLGRGLRTAAESDSVVAALCHRERPLFGVQFHPEVDLTVHGRRMLENFVRRICGLEGNYVLEDRIETAVEKIRTTVGARSVMVLVSGGVDSAVSAALLLEALGPDRVYAIHVDHGLMRKKESDLICRSLQRLGFEHLRRIDARETFFHSTVETDAGILGPLASVLDPEQKREIIGNLFVRVVREEAERLGLDFERTFVAQGTLRPDLIESGNPDVSGYAHKIKTHHNDVEIIRRARARGMIVETNWDWHKDEVREVARKLGIEEAVASRQPFPGPGLAIRCICHDGVDRVTEREREQAGRLLAERHCLGQVLPVRTVGVQGDARTYHYLTVLFGEGLSPDWRRVTRIGTEIPGKLEFVNRVAYIVNRTAVTRPIRSFPMSMAEEEVDLVRELDAVVREHLDRPPVSQVFAVLLPVGIEGTRSVAVRTFVTRDYMTGRPALIGEEIEPDTLAELTARLDAFGEIDLVMLDVTGKPPATVEWE